jgi:hypothetical protein
MEVVTLQVGNASNFSGAHFWNLDDECFAQNPEDDEADTRSSNTQFYYESGKRKAKYYWINIALIILQVFEHKVQFEFTFTENLQCIDR